MSTLKNAAFVAAAIAVFAIAVIAENNEVDRLREEVRFWKEASKRDAARLNELRERDY